jgi:hypothetical protein
MAAVVNTGIKFQIPYIVRNSVTSYATVGFSVRTLLYRLGVWYDNFKANLYQHFLQII